MRHCEELATKQYIKPIENFLDCFANARNDRNGHSESGARRISLNERSFATWLDKRCAVIDVDTNGLQKLNQYGADVYQIGVYENGQLKEVAGYGNLNAILSSSIIEYLQYSVPEN